MMAIKKNISDQEIDEMIKQTNATMAMEGFEPADFANDVFRKYAKGYITKKEALNLIHNKVSNRLENDNVSSSGCSSQLFKFCYICNKDVPTVIRLVDETYTIDGVAITAKTNVRFCSICGTDLFDEELDQITMELFYKIQKDSLNKGK